ncbi:MAG: zinc-binding dehydrogenase [Solirubrobacterales bacterium]
MYGLPFGGSWGAGLSDLVRVPYADHMLLAVPDALSAAAVVSASDNLPDAWRCVAPQLQQSPGADVLILGGGTRSTGLYAAGIAKVLGAGRVDYVDRDPGRLEIAAAYGANPIESDPAAQRLGPYLVTVDASSRAQGLGLALRSTEPGGTCTSTGIYWGDTPLPLFEMYKTGITFQTGVCHARTLLPEVLDLLSTGRFRPELAVAETVAWDDAPEAYACLTTKTLVLR